MSAVLDHLECGMCGQRPSSTEQWQPWTIHRCPEGHIVAYVRTAA